MIVDAALRALRLRRPLLSRWHCPSRLRPEVVGGGAGHLCRLAVKAPTMELSTTKRRPGSEPRRALLRIRRNRAQTGRRHAGRTERRRLLHWPAHPSDRTSSRNGQRVEQRRSIYARRWAAGRLGTRHHERPHEPHARVDLHHPRHAVQRSVAMQRLRRRHPKLDELPVRPDHQQCDGPRLLGAYPRPQHHGGRDRLPGGLDVVRRPGRGGDRRQQRRRRRKRNHVGVDGGYRPVTNAIMARGR